MKTINIDRLPLEKIVDKEGLYHKHIINDEVGFNNFTLHYARMEEGGLGSTHSHPDSEHFLLVISGELELHNDEEVHSVPAGTGIMVYPEEVHEVRNVNQGPTEYYVIYSPPRGE